MIKAKKPTNAASALFKASLKEAVRYAQGRKTSLKAETLYVRTTGADVKEARQVLRVSQPQFAKLMVVSPETVKKWEQNKNPIPAAVGYWVVGLRTQPELTKRLLLGLAAKAGKAKYELMDEPASLVAER